MAEQGARQRSRSQAPIRSAASWLAGAVLTCIIVLGLSQSGLIARLVPGPAPTALPSPTPSAPKAAILDQTSVTDPSPEFIERAQGYLEEAGYAVDIYPWQSLTVDFYRTLPGKGYGLILLQTHATNEAAGPGAPGKSTGPFIFTGEEASRKYLIEQMQDRIRPARFFYGDLPEFFAVGPAFVQSSMSGRFAGAAIIIGGCQSLAQPNLAQAFVERGASVVIGWDGLVDLYHNNRALLGFLEAVAVEGLTPQRAAEKAAEEVGSDPTYASKLVHFP
jgi:hypothetical protein